MENARTVGDFYGNVLFIDIKNCSEGIGFPHWVILAQHRLCGYLNDSCSL